MCVQPAPWARAGPPTAAAGAARGPGGGPPPPRGPGRRPPGPAAWGGGWGRGGAGGGGRGGLGGAAGPRRYGTPMTSWRPPASPAKRDELAIAYARDGYALLGAVYDPSAPGWLRELPAVDVLRRVLVQNYTRTITDGKEVIKRREKEPEGDGLPPRHARIASPYDTDARWGVKREEFWLGYKLHITETCDDAPPCSCRAAAAARPAAEGAATGGRRDSGLGHDKACGPLVFPNLITHAATTDATAPHTMTP